MKKILFYLLPFCGIILGTILAYANPNANFTISTVPAGSSILPPALATQAGFTTLAANYDFSSPAYSGSSSNWLDCGGGDDTGKVWHQDTQDFNDGYPDCNLIAQVSDGGVNVLQFTMPTGDASNSPHTQSMITRTKSGTMTASFPITGYFETEWRRNDDADFGGILFHDFWASCTNNSVGCSGSDSFEQDYVEVASTFGDAGYHNWGVSGGCNGGHDCAFPFFGNNPVDVNQYQKWAGMITSDGSVFWYCTIINGNYEGSCVQSTLTASQGSGAFSRNYLLLGIYNNPGVRSALGRMLVKNIHVWTCASNSGNGACHGTLVHN